MAFNLYHSYFHVAETFYKNHKNSPVLFQTEYDQQI